MPSSTTSAALSISQTNNIADDNCAIFTSSTNPTGVIFNIIKMVTVSSGSQPWYLVAFNIAGQTASNGTFDACRIG